MRTRGVKPPLEEPWSLNDHLENPKQEDPQYE